MTVGSSGFGDCGLAMSRSLTCWSMPRFRGSHVYYNLRLYPAHGVVVCPPTFSFGVHGFRYGVGCSCQMWLEEV